MELLFTGGRVLTMDGLDRIASGVAVRDGRIIAVGDSGDVRRSIGPDAARVDLRGRALIPGFCDPHNHFSMTTFKSPARSIAPFRRWPANRRRSTRSRPQPGLRPRVNGSGGSATTPDTPTAAG